MFVETLRAGPLPRFADEPGFDRLLSAAEAKAAAGRAAVLDLVGDKTTTRFALVVERIAAGRGWRRSATGDRLRRLSEPVVGFAASSLDRLDRKVRRRGRHFRSLSSEKRHALRISLKDLRYATEFFGGLFHPASAAEDYADKAKALQDLLGELNDAAIAQRLIKDLDRSASHGFGLCGRRRGGLVRPREHRRHVVAGEGVAFAGQSGALLAPHCRAVGAQTRPEAASRAKTPARSLEAEHGDESWNRRKAWRI